MGLKRAKWKGVLMKKKLYNFLKKIPPNFSTIKTCSRNAIITPFLIGKSIQIFNGIKFISIKISENMINHKIGEFSITRKRNFFKKKNGTKSKL